MTLGQRKPLTTKPDEPKTPQISKFSCCFVCFRGSGFSRSCLNVACSDLESLVVNNHELELLEMLQGQFNVFEAIGTVWHELRHSDFLAFILDLKLDGIPSALITKLGYIPMRILECQSKSRRRMVLLNVLRLIPVNVCVALSLVCLLSSNSNAQTTDIQNIQTFIQEAEIKQKEFATKLQGYKYILKRTEQELNDKNEVKSEKVIVYQVFPGPDGTPISMPVSEDGKDLPPERLIKEKRRVNKLWEKAREEVAKHKGGNATQEPVTIFQVSDFSMPRREHLGGREMVVLRFSPKPTKGSKKSTSQLEGQVWIDFKDKGLARIEAKLSDRYKVGGGFLFPAYLEPGTSIVIESTPLPNGIWVMTLMEFTPVPKSSLAVKIHRTKQREERSDYIPFDRSVGKVFAEL